MISMFKTYSIRQLRMEGDSIVEISRKLEVSRDTVYRYLAMEDLSQSESPPIPLIPGGGNENPYLGSRFGGFVRYTFEQRKRAVELYIECGKSVSAVRGKLGYPSRQAMYDWYADYVKHGFRPDHRPHRKFTDEQKRAAVDHCLSHGRRAAATMKALGYPARKGLPAEWIGELALGERRVRAKGSTYADGQKIDAVVDTETRSGRGADAAADHGIERAAIYKWKRGLLGIGKAGSFGDLSCPTAPRCPRRGSSSCSRKCGGSGCGRTYRRASPIY